MPGTSARAVSGCASAEAGNATFCPEDWPFAFTSMMASAPEPAAETTKRPPVAPVGSAEMGSSARPKSCAPNCDGAPTASTGVRAWMVSKSRQSHPPPTTQRGQRRERQNGEERGAGALTTSRAHQNLPKAARPPPSAPSVGARLSDF